MEKEIVQHVIVGAVIINPKGEVLIIQRSADEDSFPNLWELPSGHKEPMETVRKALGREVKEECGINVQVGPPFAVFNYQVERPHEVRDVTQINFLARPVGRRKTKLDSDHQAFAWTLPEKLSRFNLSRETKEVIKQAFAQNSAGDDGKRITRKRIST